MVCDLSDPAAADEDDNVDERKVILILFLSCSSLINLKLFVHSDLNDGVYESFTNTRDVGSEHEPRQDKTRCQETSSRPLGSGYSSQEQCSVLYWE